MTVLTGLPGGGAEGETGDVGWDGRWIVGIRKCCDGGTGGMRWRGRTDWGDPERCSGLVCGYPRALLWAGIRRSYRTRVVWWWCTQSVALGWYAVSRWDTGGGECC